MLLTIDQISNQLGPVQRLLGIDLGDKTMGISLSDTRRKLATPHTTIMRKTWKADVEELTKLIKTYDVGGLVLGMPYNMNGSEGERCKITRKFAKKFLSIYPIALIFWDERLSTKAATDLLLTGNLSYKKREKVVDKIAAAYILQGALDYMESAGHNSIE